jgi:class 3 adenylate cyclase
MIVEGQSQNSTVNILDMLEKKKKNFDAYLEQKDEEIENVIHEIWASKEEDLWRQDPYFYIRLGEVADKLGQVMFAHDVFREGMQYFPDNLRLMQLFALSSIKCGFLGKARELLSGLVKKGHQDEETLGILGRVYKDMWLLSGRDSKSSLFLQHSRNLYLRAFKKNRGYYSGINAASLSLMLGDNDLSEKLAKLVLKICMDLMKQTADRDYWGLATLGEGFLILSRFDEAKKYYGFAKKISKRNFSYLASTKKQLRLLSHYMNISDDILGILEIPPIIAFTGHMIDQPNRKTPRFPAELEEKVKEKIKSAIADLDPGIGYSSAACGSDILFLEVMQKHRAETNIVLPFELEDFFKTSIDFAGPDWRRRAQSVLQKCTQKVKATEGKYLGDDLLFDYANNIIMGKALLRSAILETEPALVAVWDRKNTNGVGGTSEFVRIWERKKLPIRIIDITKLDHSTIRVKQHKKRLAEIETGGTGGSFKNVNRVLKVLLFADLVGFGLLREEQFPYYIGEYLARLADNLKNTKYKPLFKNIWGDAIYFVFDDLIDAAEYALELRDFIEQTDWSRCNLPADLRIRIGLHVGPVFSAKEPILNRMNYFGSHVNTAARIEPITNPGNVYASEQFAALLMANPDHDLECRYVGIIVLPKKFGRYPIYHVKRKNDIK